MNPVIAAHERRSVGSARIGQQARARKVPRPVRTANLEIRHSGGSLRPRVSRLDEFVGERACPRADRELENSERTVEMSVVERVSRQREKS